MKLRTLGFISLALAFNAVASSEPGGALTILRRETVKELRTCNTTGFTPDLPVTTAYLNKIKRRLLENSTDVFRDDLAPEHICIGVQIADTGGRAWAQARNRVAILESNLMLRAQNDAQVAFVMAHELSHISLRHAYLDATPVMNENTALIQQLTGEKADLIETVASLPKGHPSHDVLNRQIDALVARINTLTEQAVGPEVNANWEEGEADQTGAHYYLRAGFTTTELNWRTQQVILNKANNEDLYSPPPAMSAEQRWNTALSICLTSNDELENMAQPTRGTHRYPGDCWAMWNLISAEPKRNAGYRQLMFDDVAIVNLPDGPTLEEVKAELRAYPEPEPVKP